MKKLLALILSLTITLGLCVFPAYAAPEWPANIAIESEGGIVIDADTGAVIYGQQMHERFYPASITKILTALIVIEECSLDEMVTFSRNAVYNVEENSSNAGLWPGDELTVRDTLYAMMLQSANEAANALAEHVSGSIDEFANRMNERAEELGCRGSSFKNPSGLNNDDHYTTAYDMALISRAALNNETFTEIATTLSYKLPVTKGNPEGYAIAPKHKMLKTWEAEYYPGAVAGKTGYTVKAGHSLVTFAERDGMRLIAVTLKGNKTHYADTKKLLDFGFNNFTNLHIIDYETGYTNIENDLIIGDLPAADLSVLSFTKDSTITLPNGFSFADTVSDITYDLTPADPANAVAKISYTYNDRFIGNAYLIRSEKTAAIETADIMVLNTVGESTAGEDHPDILTSPAETDPESAGQALTRTGSQADDSGTPADAASAAAPPEITPFEVPPVVFAVIAAILVLAALIAGFILWLKHSRQKEEEDRRMRSERRQQRLREMGVSASEFEQLVQSRRNHHNSNTDSNNTDES